MAAARASAVLGDGVLGTPEATGVIPDAWRSALLNEQLDAASRLSLFRTNRAGRDWLLGQARRVQCTLDLSRQRSVHKQRTAVAALLQRCSEEQLVLVLRHEGDGIAAAQHALTTMQHGTAHIRELHLDLLIPPRAKGLAQLYKTIAATVPQLRILHLTKLQAKLPDKPLFPNLTDLHVDMTCCGTDAYAASTALTSLAQCMPQLTSLSVTLPPLEMDFRWPWADVFSSQHTATHLQSFHTNAGMPVADLKHVLQHAHFLTTLGLSSVGNVEYSPETDEDVQPLKSNVKHLYWPLVPECRRLEEVLWHLSPPEEGVLTIHLPGCPEGQQEPLFMHAYAAQGLEQKVAAVVDRITFENLQLLTLAYEPVSPDEEEDADYAVDSEGDYDEESPENQTRQCTALAAALDQISPLLTPGVTLHLSDYWCWSQEMVQVVQAVVEKLPHLQLAVPFPLPSGVRMLLGEHVRAIRCENLSLNATAVDLLQLQSLPNLKSLHSNRLNLDLTHAQVSQGVLEQVRPLLSSLTVSCWHLQLSVHGSCPASRQHTLLRALLHLLAGMSIHAAVSVRLDGWQLTVGVMKELANLPQLNCQLVFDYGLEWQDNSQLYQQLPQYLPSSYHTWEFLRQPVSATVAAICKGLKGQQREEGRRLVLGVQARKLQAVRKAVERARVQDWVTVQEGLECMSQSDAVWFGFLNDSEYSSDGE